MGHLHMRRHGLQSTKEKPPDTNLEDKIKSNVVYCTTVDLAQPKKERSTQIYAEIAPPLQAGEANTSM